MSNDQDNQDHNKQNPNQQPNKDRDTGREQTPKKPGHENDDPVDTINYSLIYYIGLNNVGVPVEMHLYAEGKHGFGLSKTKLPITKWPQSVKTWLGTIGMISR